MSWKADKVSIGNSSLSNITLDVSGNVKISELSGADTRMVIVSPDGSLGSQAISGGGSSTIYGLFGNGQYGDATLDASITLTQEMNYNNLTINSGVYLNTAGFVIRVFGTLTINSGGHIACDGTNGGNGTSTSGGAGGQPPYLKGSSPYPYPFGSFPTPGGTGGLYTSSGTSNTSGSIGGGANTTTISSTPYILRAATGGGGGGTHGSGTNPGQSTGSYTMMIAGQGGTGRTAIGTTSTRCGGGGGGGAGGQIIIYANTINNAGTIHANGGNGGNGYYYSSTTQGGGGGGGGGGIVLLYYRNTTGSGIGTLQASGGSYGSWGSGGSNGSSGLTKYYRIQ